MKLADSPLGAKLSELSKSVWTFGICLASLKLWLTSHLSIMPSSAPHDNLRYVIMAANLMQSDVPYDRYALMRQPGYPAYIALSYLLGFSLRFSQELLYLAAGFFLAWSFYKLYHNKLVTLVFLYLYILAPGSFHWNRQTLQECLYLPLTVFIIACSIQLINLSLFGDRFLKWSAILGLGMGVFWNTRPEALAIAPTLAFVYGVAIGKTGSIKRALKPLTFSLFCITIPIFIITFIFCLSNYFKYGIFVTTDLNSPGIKAAYSSITSVSPDRWKYLVAVPKETRLEIYAASPTFRQLSGYLEGKKSIGWSKESCAETGVCDDYASGWFFWALRDAVADAGEYKSAVSTEAFYWQIAREVETACQSGKLICKDRRFSLSSFAPDFRAEYVGPFLKGIETLSSNLIHCTSVLNLGSGEEDYNLRKTYFEKIARESSDFILQRQQPINRIKDNLTTWLGGGYKFLHPIIVGVSIIGIGWEVMRWLSRRRQAKRQRLGQGPTRLYRQETRYIPFSLLWLLLSCIIIRVMLFAYINATSFPVDSGCRYLRPILPLVWMCEAIGTSYLSKRRGV